MRKGDKTLAGLLVLVLPGLLFAQVTIKPPTVVPGSSDFGSIIEQEINQILILASLELQNQIDMEIDHYLGQDDLSRGFANAGASAAHIGTQRSFKDYKLFAFTLGTGFALSAPSSDPTLIEQAINDIEDEGDIYFGAATQPIAASLGINLGHFVDNLYGTIKFGYADIQEGTLTDDFSFKSLSLGAMLDYQLLKARQLPIGFLRWRGLSVGSGLLYQRNESIFIINFPVDPVETDTIDLPDPYTDLSTVLEVDPELTLGASSSSWSIPIEATTGLRILWLLDVNLGAGVDLAFGGSDIDVTIGSPVRASQSSDYEMNFTEGSVEIDAGTEGNGPQLIRPRLTAGLSLNLGPVKLDVPLMYYFDTEGNSAMVGVNAGIVW